MGGWGRNLDRDLNMPLRRKVGEDGGVPQKKKEGKKKNEDTGVRGTSSFGSRVSIRKRFTLEDSGEVGGTGNSTG